jgi:hypothetical protein
MLQAHDLDDEARTEEEPIGFLLLPDPPTWPHRSPRLVDPGMVLVPVALLGGSHWPRPCDSPAMDDPEVGGQASGGLRLELWQGAGSESSAAGRGTLHLARGLILVLADPRRPSRSGRLAAALRSLGARFGQMSWRAYCGDYQRTLLLTSGW